MKNVLFISFLLMFSNCTSVDYYQIAKERSEKYNPPRTDYVILVDYTKDIFSKRLFVIDMNTHEIVIESKVSHAFNSGVLYARKFSNVPGSNTSSKGNFITDKTRYGKFGYSMEIKGLDKGVNDNVQSRHIIFHSNKKMKTPWSYGCFATSEDINKKILDLTNDGCLVSVID
jgi:hypothetical protein